MRNHECIFQLSKEMDNGWFINYASVDFPKAILKSVYEHTLENGLNITQWQNNFPWTDPLAINVFIVTVLSFLCWLLSILTHNYSQVDRIWSIIPFVYCWVFALTGARSLTEINPRLLAIAILTTIWGLRLSYNFARKGGYSMKEEDYRWPELRKIMHPILFQLFNITFIAPYQNILLLLITAPAYIVWLARDTQPNFTTVDYIITISWVFFFLLETAADQQQWNFQQLKKRNPKGKFFVREGLFKYSRHPNFFSEISMWWCIYAYSISATNCSQYVNWSIVGAVLLTLLFQGSTTFTEKLSLRKYPSYADYQKTTSRLFPWFPSSSPKPKSK